MKQYLICSLFLFSLFVEEGCSPTVNVENESLFPLPKETNQIKKNFNDWNWNHFHWILLNLPIWDIWKWTKIQFIK